MKLRYKKTGSEFHSGSFNVHALDEVLTGDDSAFFSELDAFIEAKGEWKDFRQALKDHDIISDNYNTEFFEPRNKEDKERGWAY